VIVASGGLTVLRTAKAATSTMPIVFVVGEDPVKLGLVASLARPGGNLTGVNILLTELTAKRFELLRELVPTAARVALLVNPSGPNAEAAVRDVQAVAPTNYGQDEIPADVRDGSISTDSGLSRDVRLSSDSDT
jgi:ABC-type uncharacterized transport system substrate-binding protein